jgi:hypothetical protein
MSRVSAKSGKNVNFSWSQIVREILIKVYTNQRGLKKNEKEITGADLKNSMMEYQEPGKLSSLFTFCMKYIGQALRLIHWVRL